MSNTQRTIADAADRILETFVRVAQDYILQCRQKSAERPASLPVTPKEFDAIAFGMANSTFIKVAGPATAGPATSEICGLALSRHADAEELRASGRTEQSGRFYGRGFYDQFLKPTH